MLTFNFIYLGNKRLHIVEPYDLKYERKNVPPYLTIHFSSPLFWISEKLNILCQFNNNKTYPFFNTKNG